MQVNTDYSTPQAYMTQRTQSKELRQRTGNDYLNELIKKYPQANISARDFANSDALKSYAMGKSGEFNDVAISPEALAKFANDPQAATEMEALLQEFLALEPRARALAESLGAKDAARGMVVDKNGDATFWMSGTVTSGTESKETENIYDKLLGSASEKKKKIEAERKEKAEEKRIEEKRLEERRERKEERRQKTLYATAESASGLEDSFANKQSDSGNFDLFV